MRFGLRTLLVAVAALCLTLGIASDRAYRQKCAVEAIVARGGKVSYREPGAWTPSWRAWPVRDFFEPVSSVFWAGASIDDDDLIHLRSLRGLRTLSLTSTSVTDAGLKHLEGLHAAMLIDLRFTQVTEAGANRLRRALPHAKILLRSDID